MELTYQVNTTISPKAYANDYKLYCKSVEASNIGVPLSLRVWLRDELMTYYKPCIFCTCSILNFEDILEEVQKYI